jgi:histidinol-phosphate aminotransferase
MFKMIATFTGLRHVGVPLQTDFSLDLPTWLDAIDRERPALIVLASPNNPTGNVFSHVQIESTIDAAAAVGALVVVDEAYYPFARENFMDGIARHPNAVLMRTVSKLGLAGIRLGFLVGAPAWLAEFDKVRLPYNINALTQAAATFALQHYPLFQAQAAAIVAERARLALALDALPGVERFASEANFILVRVPDAERTFAALLEARILVKNTSRAHPLLVNTLRLTVGTRAENDLLLAALDATLRRPR